MRALWLAALVMACHPAPTSGPIATTRRVPTAEADSPQPASDPKPAPVLAAYPEPWDPAQPVDVQALTTRTMFVTAEYSAICPTREQAQARECGNSVEHESMGLHLVRGESVLVVGSEPFDGHYRAIRYQVGGTLPSWIRADDLSERPLLDALDAFDRRADVAEATPAEAMSAAQLRALGPGALVKWTRARGIGLGSDEVGHPNTNVTMVIYVPTPGGTPVQLDIHEDLENPVYLSLHECPLLYGCLELDYLCEPKGYCDEISILARVGSARTTPPKIYADEWPEAWAGASMPVLDAVVIADRFGLWEFEGPGG